MEPPGCPSASMNCVSVAAAGGDRGGQPQIQTTRTCFTLDPLDHHRRHVIVFPTLTTVTLFVTFHVPRSLIDLRRRLTSSPVRWGLSRCAWRLTEDGLRGMGPSKHSGQRDPSKLGGLHRTLRSFYTVSIANYTRSGQNEPVYESFVQGDHRPQNVHCVC